MKRVILMCLVALFTIGAVSAQKPQKGGKQNVTTVFVTDIDCAGCAKKVNDTIPYEKGVKDVQVDVDAKTVTVTFDPAKTNNETLVKAFAKIKIKAEAKGACAEGCCGHHHEPKPAEKKACEDDCCSGHDHKAEHKHDHNHGHDHKH